MRGLAEYELTGRQTYYGLTPIDTRSTATDVLTLGWFTGLIPITVPIAGAAFGDTARAAQVSFDSGQPTWPRCRTIASWSWRRG